MVVDLYSLESGMLTKTAITGAVMQMVSHGLMTALFLCCHRHDLRPHTHTHGGGKILRIVKDDAIYRHCHFHCRASAHLGCPALVDLLRR